MAELGKAGGGSSRFLNNEEKVHDVFFEDLARAIYPVAYRLKMKLTFLEDVDVLGHWGYDGVSDGNSINFSHPSVHFGDYETIAVKVRIPGQTRPGLRAIAEFEAGYSDLSGREYTTRAEPLEVAYANNVVPEAFPTNTRVLMCDTILDVALGLRRIGELHYSTALESSRSSHTGAANWQARYLESAKPFTAVVSRETNELHRSSNFKIRRCLDLTLALKRQVENTHLRLDTDAFQGELNILNAYVTTLSSQLYLSEEVVGALLADKEIIRESKRQTLDDSLEAIAAELVADMRDENGARILFLGFAAQTTGYEPLAERLDNAFLAALPDAAITDPDRFDAILEELAITRGDLIDTGKVEQAGAGLGAENLISGYLVPLRESVLVFARFVDVKSGTVLGVAQTTIEYTNEVLELIERD